MGMEIGVSKKSLERARINLRRTVPGRLTTIEVTIGTTVYRKGVGGTCAPAGLWHERCSLYADSKWVAQRATSADSLALDAHFAEVIAAHHLELGFCPLVVA